MPETSNLQMLLQQQHARPVHAASLEMMGKHAAALWSKGRADSLTEAVVETVKSASLSPEQVRRVVEFTNHAAFREEFNKEGSHRIVDFHGGPADPGTVLQELAGASRRVVIDDGSSDYRTPPPDQKYASDRDAERAISAGFGVKEASLPFHDPIEPMVTLRDKLAGEFDSLHNRLEQLEGMYWDLSERNYFNVKQAALHGYSLGEIAAVWDHFAPTPMHVKVAFEGMSKRLLNDGVFTSGDKVIDSFSKVAHGMQEPDPTHPLVHTFSDYCEVLSKLAETRVERDEVHQAVSELNEQIKQAHDGLLKMVGKGLELSRRAGEAGGEAVFGKDKGKWVGRLAQAGAVAAPVAVANRLYRDNLEFNPGFQKAKFHGLSLIPGTAEYDAKDQEAAMRGGMM